MVAGITYRFEWYMAAMTGNDRDGNYSVR
jgi:hypothetical protein